MTGIRRRLGRHTGCLGCFGLLAAMVICLTTTTFALDRVCYTGLSQRLPLYPNAEVRSRRHNMFSEFGMGNTVIVMYSPDEPDVVRSWYGRATGQYIRGTLETGTSIERLAQRLGQGQWDVTRDESGVGTQIILFGTCAS